MRSRVVAKGEMFAKFGVEVRDFRYAFIMPRPGTARRDRDASGGDESPSRPAHPALASGKSPIYIEVKRRPDF